MKNKISKIRLNTVNFSSKLSAALLSLVPALIIILLNPIKFDKYSLKLNSKALTSPDVIFKYIDLDNDGNVELIRSYDFGRSSGQCIVINKHDNTHLGQYNLEKSIAASHNNYLFADDLNNDSIKEICLITQKDDSLFLNIFDYSKLEYIKTDKFITKIGGFNNKRDFYYRWITAEDVNGDDRKELFFNMNSGFALYPRQLFRYDLLNDTLIKSINTGIKQLCFPFHNKDGSLFFMSGSTATDNCGKDCSLPYQDTCSWLFMYDKDLRFMKKPLPFLGKPGGIFKIFEFAEGYFYLYKNLGEAGEASKIIFLNKELEIIDSLFLSEYKSNMRIHSIPLSQKNVYFIEFITLEKSNYFQFFPEKKLLKQTRYSKLFENYVYLHIFNLDNLPDDEYVIGDPLNETLNIYRNGFKHLSQIKLDESHMDLIDISSQPKDNFINIIARSNRAHFFLEYSENLNYYFKYPFWLAVYILSYMFIWFIQLTQKRRIEKQNELKNRIVALQLQNTQNQLDPHFTFNALNVVASKIYKEDKQTAYDLFERFSRLMRSSLAFSDQILRPLNEELQFTEDYLEFQKTRFKDTFNYSVHIEDGINISKEKVPKMIIQGFAENSVKHAFKGMTELGMIRISVYSEYERTVISVEDNGVGIKQSTIENPVPESGYGIKTTNEQINLINQLNNSSIELSVEDRSKTDSKHTGTIVKIRI